MSPTTKLTPGRVAAAFAIAVVADGIQLPLNALALTGILVIPSELMDLLVDGVVCIAVSLLLGGFHWVLAPTLVLEAVPGFSAVPTWTAAVAALVWIRKRDAVHGRAEAPGQDSAALTTLPHDAVVVVPESVTVLPREEQVS